MTGRTIPVHGPHLCWVWFFFKDRRRVVPCLLVCTLHSIDAGIDVEPVLSCGNDVGDVGPDELDEEEFVNEPGTTIGT